MTEPIKGTERVGSFHDFEDLNNTNTIIEKSDMTVDPAKTQRIAQYYAPDSTSTKLKGTWLEKTLYKNTAGETIGIKNTYKNTIAPSWVPTTLI